MEEIKVQVRFEIEDFADCLYYPISEWPVSDDQLEADKQERYEKWLEAKNNPLAEESETPEEA